jgi:hypothetical protein
MSERMRKRETVGELRAQLTDAAYAASHFEQQAEIWQHRYWSLKARMEALSAALNAVARLDRQAAWPHEVEPPPSDDDVPF